METFTLKEFLALKPARPQTSRPQSQIRTVQDFENYLEEMFSTPEAKKLWEDIEAIAQM